MTLALSSKNSVNIFMRSNAFCIRLEQDKSDARLFSVEKLALAGLDQLISSLSLNHE
jgi:hypothetical protein